MAEIVRILSAPLVYSDSLLVERKVEDPLIKYTNGFSDFHAENTKLMMSLIHPEYAPSARDFCSAPLVTTQRKLHLDTKNWSARCTQKSPRPMSSRETN